MTRTTTYGRLFPFDSSQFGDKGGNPTILRDLGARRERSDSRKGRMVR